MKLSITIVVIIAALILCAWGIQATFKLYDQVITQRDSTAYWKGRYDSVVKMDESHYDTMLRTSCNVISRNDDLWLQKILLNDSPIVCHWTIIDEQPLYQGMHGELKERHPLRHSRLTSAFSSIEKPYRQTQDTHSAVHIAYTDNKGNVTRLLSITAYRDSAIFVNPDLSKFFADINYIGIGDKTYTVITPLRHARLEWPSFWIFAIGGVIAAAACGYFAYKNEVNFGSSGKTIVLTMLALILLTAPWAKGCTDKVNGGITAPGYIHDSTGVK